MDKNYRKLARSQRTLAIVVEGIEYHSVVDENVEEDNQVYLMDRHFERDSIAKLLIEGIELLFGQLAIHFPLGEAEAKPLLTNHENRHLRSATGLFAKGEWSKDDVQFARRTVVAFLTRIATIVEPREYALAPSAMDEVIKGIVNEAVDTFLQKRHSNANIKHVGSVLIGDEVLRLGGRWHSPCQDQTVPLSDLSEVGIIDRLEYQNERQFMLHGCTGRYSVLYDMSHFSTLNRLHGLQKTGVAKFLLGRKQHTLSRKITYELLSIEEPEPFALESY